MSNATCPYCNKSINVEPIGTYEDGEIQEMECPRCKKSFGYVAVVTIEFETHKAPCMNGGDHEWEFVNSFPTEFNHHRCKNCGEVKK